MQGSLQFVSFDSSPLSSSHEIRPVLGPQFHNSAIAELRSSARAGPAPAFVRSTGQPALNAYG